MESLEVWMKATEASASQREEQARNAQEQIPRSSVAPSDTTMQNRGQKGKERVQEIPRSADHEMSDVDEEV